MSLKIHPNQLKSIFRYLNRYKTFKKIDLNQFKKTLKEIHIDLSEIQMDFN